MRTRTPLLASAVLLVLSAVAAAAPAWGEARDGLAVSLRMEPKLEAAKLAIHIALRNNTTSAMDVKEAFGWILLVQGRESALFSEKVPLADEKSWPAQLAPGATAEIDVALSSRKAFAFAKGLKLASGYPEPEQGGAAPRELDATGKAIPQGKIIARWTLVLPRNAGPLILMSNPVAFEVTPPARPWVNPELVEKFRRDAFAAKAAHDQAVQIGPSILPDLVEIASDASFPGHGRMWAATAMIDLKDDKAVDPLVKLVESGDGAVGSVIAYHGAKLKNAKLTDAILARAGSGKDPEFTAWAARGMTTFAAGEFPDKLIDIALKSSEPRARAEVADVLAGRQARHADLLNLLKDDHELVRLAAARAIGQAKLKSPQAISALIIALDKPSDASRQGICEVLTTLTGREGKYDAKASAAEKQKVVDGWKQWWATQKR